MRALAVLLVVSLLTVSCGPQPPPPSAPSALLERAVPSFKRRTLDGTEIATESLRGKVVVVKFFAKYCEPCKRTLPAIERLHKARPDMVVIGIAEDEHESDAREITAQFGLTFPVIHDTGNALSGRFRVTEMPSTFVVDRAGSVRWVGGPEATEAQIEQAIDAWR